MGNDGGDWGAEKPTQERGDSAPAEPSTPEKERPFGEDSTSAIMPVIAVFVAILSFFGVLFVLVFADTAKSMFELAGFLVNIDEHREEAAQKQAQRAQAREAEQRARAEKKEQEQALRARVEQLAEEVLRAAVVDFDPQKRDALARELAASAPKAPGARVDLEAVLYRAGAHDILLEQPPRGRAQKWFNAAVLAEAWDRIRTSGEVEASQFAARAFCLAGAQQGALATFAELRAGLAPSSRPQITELAIACGGKAPEWAHDRRDKKRPPPRALEQASKAFVAGEIEPAALIEAATKEQLRCDLGYVPGLVGASPDLLAEAASRLGAADVADRAQRDVAVRKLRLAETLAAHTQLDDRRSPELAPQGAEERLCLARVEMEFDPTAAVKRLQNLLRDARELRYPEYPIRSLLVEALAQTGDFDAAFEAAQEALKHAEPKHRSSLDANWLAIAMGHAAERLGEVALLGDDELPQKVLDALRGTDSDRAEVRLSPALYLPAPHAARAYLQGALARGHEETFVDGLFDDRAPLSIYLRQRADAARWRGDTDAAEKWTQQRARMHARAADGQHGGLPMLWIARP